ncbi:MarR family transcriptional regulator [Solirubrobacter sp. CPCC 204708]|nr:MarR family transcriptional regulator [Solirubrobacter deserti]
MAVIARLLHVGRRIEALLGESAKEHGLQVADGDVLFTLRRAGRLSPGQLSESLLVSTGTMTGRLDRLEKRGLLRRVPHTTDRRALLIELTHQGHDLVDRVIAEHLAREHEWLSAISADEREQLARITRKLLAKLSAG